MYKSIICTFSSLSRQKPLTIKTATLKSLLKKQFLNKIFFAEQNHWHCKFLHKSLDFAFLSWLFFSFSFFFDSLEIKLLSFSFYIIIQFLLKSWMSFSYLSNEDLLFRRLRPEVLNVKLHALKFTKVLPKKLSFVTSLLNK